MAQRSHMTSRRRRDRRSDEALGALALLLLAALSRTLTGMSWRTLLILGVFGTSLAVLIIRWVIQRQRRQARERLLLRDAASLSPSDFERRVQILLQDLGWEQVEHVGGAGDGGVDLRGVFAGQRYIVQWKRYTGIVGPTQIRDLAGALDHESAEQALLVTTVRVSQRTRAWVAHKPIEIWDGDMLARQFHQAEEAQRAPERIAHNRRRTRRFLGVLIGVNVLALLLALAIPDSLVPIRVVAHQYKADESTPVARSSTSSIAAPGRQRRETAVRPTPTVTNAAELSAIVANGGNVRAQPTMQGAVLDQVHARERVMLLGRTGDGTWYQISDARSVVGWVHESLLHVDQLVGKQVPTAVP